MSLAPYIATLSLLISSVVSVSLDYLCLINFVGGGYLKARKHEF